MPPARSRPDRPGPSPDHRTGHHNRATDHRPSRAITHHREAVILTMATNSRGTEEAAMRRNLGMARSLGMGHHPRAVLTTDSARNHPRATEPRATRSWADAKLVEKIVPPHAREPPLPPLIINPASAEPALHRPWDSR